MNKKQQRQQRALARFAILDKGERTQDEFNAYLKRKAQEKRALETALQFVKD